jgi:DNA processing protein
LLLCPDAEDWLTLTFLPGLGCSLINRLVQEAGSAAAVLRRGALPKNIPGIGPRIFELLADGNQVAAARKRAQLELDQLAGLDISLLTLDSAQYPDSLRSIPDSPVLLYCRGGLQWLERPAVAIIGSRAATEYGRRVSALLAAELVAAGLTVVSGAAYGIDAAAHRGALQAGGGTVAVLGCGVDVVYPRSHAGLFREMVDCGVLVSEYPLGAPPEGFRFPARNRIISGLVKGVVVVEATEKSGSLITARLALDQGREVFAVPGRIDSPKSVGTHRLLQQGAHLVQTVEDILEGLSWAGSAFGPGRQQREMDPTLPVTPQERLLLDHLDTYPRDIDTIVRMTDFAIVELHGLLLQLELKGLVRQLPGQQYERLASD